MLRVRGLSGVLSRLKAEVTRAFADREGAQFRYRADEKGLLSPEGHVIVRQGRQSRASFHQAARNWPRSTAGRSLSSTSTASSTPSTTCVPTTAAHWLRASSSGCEIMCPRHGARFDVRTGKALCMPAVEPVAVHSVEIRGEDVYVAVSDD